MGSLRELPTVNLECPKNSIENFRKKLNFQPYHLQLTTQITEDDKRSTGTLGTGGSKFITRKSRYLQLIRAPSDPSGPLAACPKRLVDKPALIDRVMLQNVWNELDYKLDGAQFLFTLINKSASEIKEIVLVSVRFSKQKNRTATAGSYVVQSGRPIFDDFFQHLWPYIGNNTANVVFEMVERLWLIRMDQ
ncbi:hypothetical protein TNCV_648901 [Trichonephila clavipes]|uniref:Uncharacterized protein n=1 Tax=Trichonephila clavipes TaxID=2585209 RepID=A0A8X6ST67_TRICX|nr:hypothetical protein TNCV_648901 [Trichonephila clavipes]